MLAQRLITAAVLLPPVLLVFYFGGVIFLLFALAVFALVNYEFYRFSCPAMPRQHLQYVLCSLLLPLGYLLFGWSGLSGGLLLAVLLMMLLHVVDVETAEHQPAFEQVVPASMLGLCYPGFLGALIVVVAAAPSGNVLMTWLLLVVIATDSLAYFGGRLFGGPKLSPRISPNKTIAGAVSGLVGAIAGALLGAWFLDLGGNLLAHAVLGLLAGVLAELGDLVESLVKRSYGVKDSGNILPGHGGFFDRVDSILFACPVLFLV